MKEAVVAIRESYKNEIKKYLKDTFQYCEKTNREDEQFIVEAIYEILDKTPVDKRLSFDYKHLGF